MTSATAALKLHPLAAAIRGLPALRVFMEHHVFAVWDFLVLAKALQWQLSEASGSGRIPGHAAAFAVINRIVAEEECDEAPPNPLGASHLSHLQIYLLAMAEVGASTASIQRLMERWRRIEPWTISPAALTGVLEGLTIPEPSRRFMAFTFEMIGSHEALPMAVAFTHGRELLVPTLFEALLDRAVTPPSRFPLLQWYLERHIAMDGDDHGPSSLAMVSDLCGGSAIKLSSARMITSRTIEARRQLWDGIHRAGPPKSLSP